MLGSRTRQVNAYGRRSSRIVNASDRKEPSEVASDAADVLPSPTKRGNTPIISPKRHRVGFHGFKGSNRSQRGSQLAQNQTKGTRDVATKRIQPKAGTHIRQPLTPLRPNGALLNDQPSVMKRKSNASTIKPIRASLKPQSPVVSVDIILLDEGGNTLTQERRLSYTEVRADPVSTIATRQGKKITKPLPSPPPVIVSDDTGSVMEISPKPITKRRVRRHHPVMVSSDESGTDENGAMHVPPVNLQHSKSRSLRVEVVIPPAPFRNPRLAESPQRPPLALTNQWAHTPPRFFCRSVPAPAPSQFIPPIPIPKPRQLTPIRGSSGHPIFRPSPPTPSTPTEADLSLDLAQLKLFDAPETVDPVTPQPEYLVPLLSECAQTSPYEFSAFIETFPFDPIVQSSAEVARFHKIGEASYSEVFGIGDVVLKIIPIRPEEESDAAEIPSPSDAYDVLKEMVVTREIGGICDKFVRLLKTYVVRGKYPSLLLDLWDDYNERKGSESIRPDSFGLTQVYVIIILPNGGPDLESFAFKNASKSGWHQACGIFWQVARALGQAEELVQFEHRDLHWGQILVKSVPIRKSASKCDSLRMAMDDIRFGVEVTIIDLGLSRMSAVGSSGSEVYWTAFDQEVFEGEGDYQYDIYRLMRDVIGSTWELFHPLTNILWLHYLVTKLLCEKRLKLPGSKRQTNGETRVVSLTGYDEQQCYDCLVEMERLLGNCVALVRKGQRRRKTVVATDGPKCARDVLAHGKRQGWVR